MHVFSGSSAQGTAPGVAAAAFEHGIEQWIPGRIRMYARRSALAFRSLLAAFVLPALSAGAGAQNQILAWGSNTQGECNVPAPPSGLEWSAIAAGAQYSLALLADGTIQGWGSCAHGQCTPDPLPPGLLYVDVVTSSQYTLALRSDGQIIPWGVNDEGQCDVPALPPRLNYVQVSAGHNFAVALRSDGSAVAWGGNNFGECKVPALPAGLAYVEVAAGTRQGVARRSDGSLVSWGLLPAPPALPHGITCVEVSAGFDFALARLSDGSVIGWGVNDQGQCNVPPLPGGVVYADISAGMWASLARRSDGSLVAWGNNSAGLCNVPALPPGFTAARISAGYYHMLALLEPGPACGSTSYYCSPAAANSVNPAGASLTVDGCPGLTANDLVLSVTGLPPHGPGIFFYGSQQRFTTNGFGRTCIGGAVQRILPPVFADASGTVALPLDLTQFPFSGSPQSILPGSTWNFQYWYRDPAGSQSTYNFSDACHLVFAP
jgi:hypothetical protein